MFMPRTRADRYKNWKVATFWFLGAACALIASMIGGHAEIEVGTTPMGFAFSLMVAFILFLIAGILWISVAIAIKELEER